MPKRRRIQAGISAGLASLSEALGSILSNRMIEGRQKALADETTNRQLLTSVMGQVDEIGPDFVKQHGPAAAKSRFDSLRRRLPASMQGQLAEPDFAGMDIPQEGRAAEALLEGLKFDNPEQAPSKEGAAAILSKRRISPTSNDFALNPSRLGFGLGGDIPLDSPELANMMREIEAKAGGLRSEREAVIDRAGRQAQATALGSGRGQEQAAAEAFPTASARRVDEAERTSFAQARGTGLGQEEAEALSFPAALDRKLREFGALTPLHAQRAAAESWARLPAELERLKQQHALELVQAGKRAEAELMSQKKASIDGLMPIYQKYRQLAVDVATGWAGAGSSASGSIVNAVGKLPAIGEFLASGMEAGHAVVTNVFSGEMGQKVSELNRLTDTLAQGMANSVIGNRGATTENDRRTAKNILASSFTDAKTLGELLDITDKMFMILPTVSAEMLAANPQASASEILLAAQERVRAQGSATRPATPGQGQQLSPTAQRAQEILNAR